MEDYGPKGLLIARKHMGWTCQGFAGAAELRQALMRAPSAAAARELLRRAAEAIKPSGSRGLACGPSPGPAAADRGSP
jgi:tRNA-dihydrouridine synthase B